MQAGSGSTFAAVMQAPCCALGIWASAAELEGICFLPSAHPEFAPQNALAERACAQIARYLENPGFSFDLPLAPRGTPFQRRVWRRIAAIPMGRTRSYGDIAREIGSAPRAVGQACGANAYPLLIPCHRVVAVGGLGGFAHRHVGFLPAVKRWLLAHEGVQVVEGSTVRSGSGA